MNPFEPFQLALPVLIRPCREDDLSTLEWFGMFSPHRQIIREIFEKHRRGEAVMLVADANGVASGQVWVDPARFRSDSTGVLWALRVFPSLQNRGLGSRLVCAGEQILQERGLKVSQVEVEKSNSSARRLYEKLGYRTIDQERKEFHYAAPDGTPAILPLDRWILRKTLNRVPPFKEVQA